MTEKTSGEITAAARESRAAAGQLLKELDAARERAEALKELADEKYLQWRGGRAVRDVLADTIRDAAARNRRVPEWLLAPVENKVEQQWQAVRAADAAYTGAITAHRELVRAKLEATGITAPPAVTP